MRTAETLLRIITKRYPPPEGMRHSLVLERDKIILFIPLGNGGSFMPIHFDDDDYRRSPEELAEDILERLRRNESIRDPLPPERVTQ
jgi:hypothetical protein